MNITQRKQRNKDWKKYYYKNREILNKKRRIKLKLLYAKDSRTFKERSQAYRDSLKLETFRKYSEFTPKCKNCGLLDIRALCLDHTKNNGSRDRQIAMRKNVGGSGSRFYAYLKRKKYPKGYQVLCANCNLIKEIERRQGWNLP